MESSADRSVDSKLTAAYMIFTDRTRLPGSGGVRNPDNLKASDKAMEEPVHRLPGCRKEVQGTRTAASVLTSYPG